MSVVRPLIAAAFSGLIAASVTPADAAKRQSARHTLRKHRRCMARTLVVLCTLAAGLTGCATHREPPTPDHDQLKEQDAAQKKAQPTLAAKYSDCNRAAAKAVAFQQDDPVSLAVFAERRLCARFEPELEKAVKTAYGDIIDPSDVNRTIEHARDAMIERNAAEIAAYRAARASAPPPPKPPQTYDADEPQTEWPTSGPTQNSDND